MRMSDWSSDVCSSDLVPAPRMSSELLNSVGSTQLRFDSVPDPVVPKCGQIGIEVAKFGIKGKQLDVCATCALGKRLEGNPASVIVITRNVEAYQSIRKCDRCEMQIGRASCRERVCQYVSISGGPV